MTAPAAATPRAAQEAESGKARSSFPWLALPATVWVLAVFAVPTGILLADSFLSYDGASLTGSLTSANYTGLFGDGYFRSVLWDTVWMSVAVGGVCTVAGLVVAHFLVRSTSRLRALVLLVVVSPLVSSVVVRTYGWLVLLQDDGLLNKVLLWTGLTHAPVSFIGSRLAVVLGLVHVLLPFAMFTQMSSLQGVDPALERASRDLGAGAVTTFFRITLPLIRPGVIGRLHADLRDQPRLVRRGVSARRRPGRDARDPGTEPHGRQPAVGSGGGDLRGHPGDRHRRRDPPAPARPTLRYREGGDMSMRPPFSRRRLNPWIALRAVLLVLILCFVAVPMLVVVWTSIQPRHLPGVPAERAVAALVEFRADPRSGCSRWPCRRRWRSGQRCARCGLGSMRGLRAGPGHRPWEKVRWRRSWPPRSCCPRS